MSWIVGRNDGLISWDDDRLLLNALAILQKAIVNDGTLSASNAFEVVESLSEGTIASQQSSIVTNLLSASGITSADLTKAWDRIIKRWDGGNYNKYKPLLYSLEHLNNEATPAGDRIVEWEISTPNGTPHSATAGEVLIKMSGGVTANAVLEVVEDEEDFPDELKGTGLATRLGVGGTLKGDFGADVPISVGRVGVAASGKASSSLDYYFKADNSAIWAGAIARDLLSLENPFSIRSVGTNDRIKLIHLKAGGSLTGTAKIEVAHGFDIAEGIAATVGAGITAIAKWEGDFDYHIYRPINDPGVVRVRIVRGRQSGLGATVSANLAIDATALASTVKEEIDKHLEEYEKVLKRFQDYRAPGKLIENELDKAIDKFLADSKFAALLEEKLGLELNKHTSNELRKLVLGKVDSAENLWSSSVDKKTLSIAASIFKELPIQLRSDASLVDELAEALGKPLKKLSDKLARKIKDEVDKHWTALGAELKSAGEQLRGPLNSFDEKVEAATKSIERILMLYQKAASSFSKVVEKASKAKLEVGASASVYTETGEEILATVDFLEINAETEAAFKKLITGSLDDVLKLARRVSDVKGSSVVLLEGAFKEYDKTTRGTGFSVVLLDVKLGGESIIEAHTEFTSDVAGNVSVMSKLEVTRAWRTLGESKELHFVNVYRLAAANQTKSLALSLSLSRKDDDLTQSELRTFMGAVEAGGLIPNGSTDYALEQLRAYRNSASATSLKAEVNLGFSLSFAELLQLLSIENPDGGIAANPLSEVRREEIKRVAIEEIIVAQNTFRASLLGQPSVDVIRAEVEGVFTGLGLGETFEDQVLNIPASNNQTRLREKIRKKYGFQQTMIFAYLEMLLPWRNRVFELVDSVQVMRSVFFSSGWDKKKYQSKQIELGRHLGGWLGIQKAFVFFLSDEIRPYTLAYVDTLRRLASTSGTDHASAVKIAISLDDDKVFSVGG